jgi:hypothetical protein
VEIIHVRDLATWAKPLDNFCYNSIWETFTISSSEIPILNHTDLKKKTLRFKSNHKQISHVGIPQVVSQNLLIFNMVDFHQNFAKQYNFQPY